MNYTSYEAFGGIGAWGKALERVTARHNDQHKLLGYWEFDKYASNAFAVIHKINESLNMWDITKVVEYLEECDIFFYSPPCQSFSIAGKKEGTEARKGNLFWNTIPHIKKTNPKFCIMENVANLANQFRPALDEMLLDLEKLGYINYAKVLNSKDYGIPQNRERIFIVSIRKDIYNQGHRFEWPKKIKLEKRLKDLLESNVAEKYYLSDKLIKGFIRKTEDKNNGFGFKPSYPPHEDNAFCLTARYHKTAASDQYIAEPKIKVKSATKCEYEIAEVGDSINLDQPTSTTRRGRVGKGVAQTLTTSCNQATMEYPCIAASRGRDKNNPSDRTVGNKNLEQRLEVNKNGTANTLTNVQKDNYVMENEFRIRKLTPLECFRLQGFDDEDYYRAFIAYEEKFGKLEVEKLITWKKSLNKNIKLDSEINHLVEMKKSIIKSRSDSQMYKRAGNSITVNVIEEILENLLYQRKQEGSQLTIF